MYLSRRRKRISGVDTAPHFRILYPVLHAIFVKSCRFCPQFLLLLFSSACTPLPQDLTCPPKVLAGWRQGQSKDIVRSATLSVSSVPFRQTTVSLFLPPPPSQPPSPGCQRQAPAHTVSLPQGALLSGRAVCYAVGSCPREHATVPSGTNNHLFTTFCQMHVSLKLINTPRPGVSVKLVFIL